MKVIGYTRVSTEEQATSGVSLAAQAAKLQSYAQLYGLEIIEIIEDGGQSAKNLKRPGIERVLQMLRGGQVQGIVVAKLDRLTRSVSDWDFLIKEYFGEGAKHPVSLLSVGDQVDTRTAAGRLVLNVLMSVAQWERETISERTREAFRYLKTQGRIFGAEPMGKTAKEKDILLYIKSLRDQGLALHIIAARLNAEGVKSKKGGKWGAQTVKNCLKRLKILEVAFA